jgi:hypothetical protein
MEQLAPGVVLAFRVANEPRLIGEVRLVIATASFAAGFGVGVAVDAGFGVGVGVGLGTGLGVGAGVGRSVGVGVATAVTRGVSVAAALTAGVAVGEADGRAVVDAGGADVAITKPATGGRLAVLVGGIPDCVPLFNADADAAKMTRRPATTAPRCRNEASLHALRIQCIAYPPLVISR